MGANRETIEQLDAELRRVADAADALVRGAQDLRAALDSLADGLREAAREGSRAATPTAAVGERAENGTIPEGARLVALDMVLDGASRDDVAARLREEFDLTDSDALLDEVYARVGK